MTHRDRGRRQVPRRRSAALAAVAHCRRRQVPRSSPAERTSGLSLSRALQLARNKVRSGETDLNAIRLALRAEMEQTPGVSVDYATIVDPESLVDLTEIAPLDMVLWSIETRSRFSFRS